ncbi:MAG: outer membrane beta-barrel protein [Crocinitomicaceae bacterium]|nr:outer membrane beta-barrel protein [Crocinitomicaceae bacterium]
MKTICLIAALLWSSAISAQHDIGLDLGISRIYSSQMGSAIEYKFLPSGNFGAYYRFKPEESRSNLYVELMISQIEGNSYSEGIVTDADFNVIGESTFNTYYHITSISLPVYYGLQFKKIGFLLGAEISLPIYSAYNSRSEIPYNGSVETYTEQGSPLYIDVVHFNGRFGFEWLISDKLLLRATYSHGLNVITRQNGLPWRTQQISLGLRYSLMKKQSD